MKITGVLRAGAVVLLILGAQAAQAEWPWSSSSKEPAKKPTAKRPGPAQPSALDKFNTGVKNFFTKTGEALSLKKPEPKKTSNFYQPSKVGRSLQKKKPEKKSWFGSLLKPEERPRPQTPSEWLGLKRLDP